MNKTNKSKIDIDNLEKILVKNLENKKEKKSYLNNKNEFSNEKSLNLEDFSKEIIDFNKSIPEDNQVLFHFDRNLSKEQLEQIILFNSNKAANFKHNLKFYNSKIGEYNYTYFDSTKSTKANKPPINEKSKLLFFEHI